MESLSVAGSGNPMTTITKYDDTVVVTDAVCFFAVEDVATDLVEDILELAQARRVNEPDDDITGSIACRSALGSCCPAFTMLMT